MAVVPTMMVLYTNDAVDVRYSDGSALQLSPCGSSMFHHDCPAGIPKHPLAGMPGVQKWTQFVTSAHKNKVLQAVDFRNRFASRPFLCSTLMAPEDIVSLYARIDQIAWGKTVDESHIEILEDGSRRIVSLDEYASLILSPHGQDFTVCYLSGISQDTVDSSAVHQSQCSSHVHGVHYESIPMATGSSQAEIDSEGFGGHKQTHEGLIEFDSAPKVSHDGEQKTDSAEAALNRNCKNSTPVSNVVSVTSDEVSVKPDSAEVALNRNRNNSTPVNEILVSEEVSVKPDSAEVALNRNRNNSTPVNEILVSEEVSVNASGLILSDGTVSTPGRTAQLGDLQTSAFSMQHDISSISRASTPDGLRGVVECDDTLTFNDETNIPPVVVLHSSPLSLASMQHTREKTVTKMLLVRLSQRLQRIQTAVRSVW